MNSTTLKSIPSNYLTTRQIYISVIALLSIIFTFTAPFNQTILTVNEELFVIISFIIFVDLFGNTIVNSVAIMADSRINLITQKLITLLIQRFLILSEVYARLSSIDAILFFKKRIAKKFYSALKAIIKNRILDFAYLYMHTYFIFYKQKRANTVLYYKIVTTLALEKVNFQLTEDFISNKIYNMAENTDKNAFFLLGDNLLQIYYTIEANIVENGYDDTKTS